MALASSYNRGSYRQPSAGTGWLDRVRAEDAASGRQYHPDYDRALSLANTSNRGGMRNRAIGGIENLRAKYDVTPQAAVPFPALPAEVQIRNVVQTPHRETSAGQWVGGRYMGDVQHMYAGDQKLGLAPGQEAYTNRLQALQGIENQRMTQQQPFAPATQSPAGMSGPDMQNMLMMMMLRRGL